MIIIKEGGGKIISGASMKEVPNILWLEEIRKEDISSVGGKGASLGEMASIGLPVPRAFVVTAQAFRRFLVETGLEKKLFAAYDKLDVENNEALEKAADTAKAMVLKAKMPLKIRDEIRAAYKKMDSGSLIVAVRSSATAEDLPDASFAGQQETYLNIKGEAALVEAVQKCWASLYGARAIYYRAKQGFDDHTVNIAVVVQQLVHSEKAGVMFTSHPITGEPLTIIEGSWGLGEAVVSGSVSPDKYVFDQRTEKVVDTLVSNKKVEIIADGDHGTKLVDVSPARQDAQVLSDEEVAKLAMYGKIAENHYGIPQDVEWGIVAGTFYILQSRPDHDHREQERGKGHDRTETECKDSRAGTGSSTGHCIRQGRHHPGCEGHRLGKGGRYPRHPDDEPGHGAGHAQGCRDRHRRGRDDLPRGDREPGTGHPGRGRHKDGNERPEERAAGHGRWREGAYLRGCQSHQLPRAQAAAAQQAVIGHAPIITATSVKVNVSIPEAAARAAATGADGVGLLRIEHLILGLNKTPGWFIANNKEEEFVRELHDGIKIVLDAFPGKTVWVRTLDAPTDEFRNMKGGENEPHEHNPMLGWRGIRRDLQSPDQFRLQVEAFKQLWKEGYDNLGIMFPMVSHPDQFIAGKRDDAGLGRGCREASPSAS